MKKTVSLASLILLGSQAVMAMPDGSNCLVDAEGIVECSDEKDRYEGTDGNDLVYGLDGDDRLRGFDGDDKLFGNGGNDTIIGGNDHDVLRGGPGDDHLSGGKGNDRLIGGRGNDYLSGGNGINHFRGGRGDDVIYLHQSDNHVVYRQGDYGDDTIRLRFDYIGEVVTQGVQIYIEGDYTVTHTPLSEREGRRDFHGLITYSEGEMARIEGDGFSISITGIAGNFSESLIRSIDDFDASVVNQ